MANNQMLKFWFTLAGLIIMLVYQALLGALATHIPGFELPPIYVYIISVMAPVVLLAAHAIPFVLNSLPGGEPTPLPKD